MTLQLHGLAIHTRLFEESFLFYRKIRSKMVAKSHFIFQMVENCKKKKEIKFEGVTIVATNSRYRGTKPVGKAV